MSLLIKGNINLPRNCGVCPLIAIAYCYKVAMSSDPNVCVEYKAEHMRLCGWLGDLRRRIEAEQALKERENNAR